jgi:hypothetical protein
VVLYPMVPYPGEPYLAVLYPAVPYPVL